MSNLIERRAILLSSSFGDSPRTFTLDKDIDLRKVICVDCVLRLESGYRNTIPLLIAGSDTTFQSENMGMLSSGESYRMPFSWNSRSFGLSENTVPNWRIQGYVVTFYR